MLLSSADFFQNNISGILPECQKLRSKLDPLSRQVKSGSALFGQANVDS